MLALLIKRVGYSLLTDAERRLLEWLSIFAGGWTLEAAEAVCAGDGIDAEHVLELLARLVDKSLVVSAGPAVGPVWCRLLEPLRQDARERLVARGEMEVLNGRQAAYFLARAESVQPDLLGPTAMLGLDQLDRDHANLRLALSWLVDQPDVERAQRLAGTLGRFWLVRAHFTEGEGWFRQALALPGSERRSAARAACVYGLGSLRLAQGDYVTAEAQLDEALVLFREAGNRVGEAWRLMGLGQAARLRGKHGAARARLEERVAASRVAAQSAPESMSQQVLADVAYAEGDLRDACAHAEAALGAATRAGWLVAVANAHRVMGKVEFAEANTRAARVHLEASLVAAREVGSHWLSTQASPISDCVLPGRGRTASQLPRLPWLHDSRPDGRSTRKSPSPGGGCLPARGGFGSRRWRKRSAGAANASGPGSDPKWVSLPSALPS